MVRPWNSSVLVCFWLRWPVAWMALGLAVACWPTPSVADEPAARGPRCAVVEVYLTGSRDADLAAAAEIRAFAAERGSIELVVRDIENDQPARERFERIRAAYRKPSWGTPLAYACGQAAAGGTVEQLLTGLGNALMVEVFTRRGCSRCARAKAWLPGLMARYPAWRLSFRELSTDDAAVQRLQQLVNVHQTAAASVPVIHVCGKLVIGFDQAETTGARVEEALATWSRPCQPAAQSSSLRSRSAIQLVRLQAGDGGRETSLGGREASAAEPFELPLPPLPVAPLPGETVAGAMASSETGSDESSGIELPWLGRVEWKQLGMPVFTLLVGLIDGFNPCAMWVGRWLKLISGLVILVLGLVMIFKPEWLG